MKTLEQYIEESLLDDIGDLEQKSDDIVKISSKLIGHYNVGGIYISGVTHLNKYLDKNAIKKLGIKAKLDIFKVYRNGRKDNSPLSSYISMLGEYIMYNTDIKEFENAINYAKTKKDYQYIYVNVNEYMPGLYRALSKLLLYDGFTIDIWQDKNIKINFERGNKIEIELEEK